jgi:hypothetical protein
MVMSATRTTTDPPDPEEVARFAFRVWGYKQGEMVSLLVHLGDRLGLYRALDGAGLITAEDLAGRTGQPLALAARVAAGQRGGRPAGVQR